MSDVIKVGSAEDEALLLELRSAGARLDPVPDEAVLAARSAFAYRHLDADLAELTADSVVEDRRLSLVRGIGAPALLTFEAPGLTLEVEILCEGRTRRLVGQLVPAGPGRLEARHRHGSVEVDVDEVGAFTVSDVPPGPVSLGCEAAGSRRVETDWFLV